MSQLSLFDQCVVARRNDPQTSVDAATEVMPKLEGRRAEFVRCLSEIGYPSTAQEIAARAPAEIRESVRKRAAECVSLGAVTVIGTKQCEVTGKRATAYWVN